ncbi:insulinase family protein [Pseudomonas sp. 21LCFQ02]|uniref:M16 family metallopeptidase n=1 Tax=Pseudomonas sp. 21LCFQ02 TaxID=2957505 RepID=UPI00209A78F9|nr:M16 family metallopeptidase [Pseudomonas sp. 21LCFQ02]MCO8168827.1 insulinase family protein [Pseudomonas sp. 21LCFQ02]
MVRFIVSAWLVLVAMPGLVQADTRQPVMAVEHIAEYRLANGLTVILAPDSSVGTLNVDLVYRSGSLADPQGRSGTAHLLEHLMFKGTPQRSGEQLTDGLRQRGIQFNATTSYDRTRYSAVLSDDPQALDYLLALEAERMTALRFEPAALQAETEVVLREMERAQGQALPALTQQLLAASWQDQGYGRPVLGHRDELRRISLDELRRFHALHYHPANAVLVLTGKFDRAAALATIDQHFAPLRSTAEAPAPVLAEPAAAQAPVTVELKQGKQWVVALSYPLPAAADERNLAVSVLADALAGEPHGRLYQALVVPGHASAVYAVQQVFGRGGHYLFGALLEHEASRETVQRILLEQVKLLATQPLSAAELQRSKTVAAHSKAQWLSNPALLSSVLAESAVAGGWSLPFQRLERLAQLDVQTVSVQNRALLAEAVPVIGHLAAGSGAAVAVSEPPPRPVAPAASTAAATEPAQPLAGVDVPAFNQRIMAIENGITRGSLNNGMKVALRPLPGSARPVQGTLNLRFGDLESLWGQRAVAELAGTLLIRGSQHSSYQQIVDRVNQLGAGLSVVPHGGVLTVRFQSPKQNLPELLALLAEVLRQPSFPAEGFDQIKRQRLQALRSPAEPPAAAASRALRQHTERYAPGDIRHHPAPDQMYQAVEAVSRDQVLAFYQKFYGTQHGELALSGDFDAEQVQAQLNTLFGDWLSQAPYQRIVPRHEPVAALRQHVKSDPAPSGHFIGRLHFAANGSDEDAAALFVIEHILGRHPLASRLGKRLREREQLSYDLRSSIRIPAAGDAAWLSIQGDYPAGQGARLADIVAEEVRLLATSGISQAELSLAKQTILGERQRVMADDQSIHNLLVGQMSENVTLAAWVTRNDAFAAMTQEQVNTLARRYLEVPRMTEIMADAKPESTSSH